MISTPQHISWFRFWHSNSSNAKWVSVHDPIIMFGTLHNLPTTYIVTQTSMRLPVPKKKRKRKLPFHNHQNDQSALLLHNDKAKLKQKPKVPMEVCSSFFLLQFPLRKLSKTRSHGLLLTEEGGDIEQYFTT